MRLSKKIPPLPRLLVVIPMDWCGHTFHVWLDERDEDAFIAMMTAAAEGRIDGKVTPL